MTYFVKDCAHITKKRLSKNIADQKSRFAYNIHTCKYFFLANGLCNYLSNFTWRTARHDKMVEFIREHFLIGTDIADPRSNVGEHKWPLMAAVESWLWRPCVSLPSAYQ